MKQILGAILLIVSLLSCGGRQSSPQADGDTLQLKYASLLTIVQHDGYTEAGSYHVDRRCPTACPTAP